LLAPVSFGRYSVAFAFVGLFRLLPDLGMSYASTLAISRDRALARPLVWNLLGFQTLLSLLSVLLCLGIGHLLYSGETWIAVVVLSFDLVFKAFKSTLRWALKSLERYGVEAVSLLAERSAILLLAGASLLAGYGIVPFVLVFACVRLVDMLGLAAYVTKRVLPLGLAFDRSLWRDLILKGLPFAYVGLMLTLTFQVDAVLLEAMRGPAEVGFYRAPTLVLEGLTLVPRVIGYALIPTMAALHASAPEVVTELYRRGSKYLLLAGLPVAVLGILESDRLIPQVFGIAYQPSIVASTILLPATLFMFLSNFGETTLACIDRWGAIVVVSTAALLLNVALNLVWIPAQGYRGAAWATLATEVFYFVATAAALAAYGHRISWLRLVLRPAGAALAFGLTLAAVRAWPLVLAASLAAAVLLVASLVLGVWDRKEREAVAELLRGGRPDARRLA
jgi:O-antigen/teichoic acid export membrane protein